MKKTIFIFFALVVIAGISWMGCKKSSSSSSNSSVALVIQTGAQSVAPGASIPFTAVLLDKSGNVTTPSSVTWTVTGTGGASIGSFSGSVFTGNGVGDGTITATVNVNGTNLTASIPIGVYTPSVFAVVPSAVIWTTGAGTIQLTPVYIGTGSTTYTYSSSDASIASVDASGNITFNKNGQCLITVTAGGLTGTPAVSVPVMVVGMPNSSLPVMRVAVTPVAPQMFRGDNTTLTAKAYDMSGNVVTSSTFAWASQDASIATVDQSGKVTAVKLGRTIITATASGITGQAEVDVLPDTAIIVTPYWATVAAGGTQQFTDTVYAVNHTTKALTPISGFSAFTWMMPTFGIPAVDSIFDIATVSSTGLVTMKTSAMAGVSSFVMAAPTSPTIAPGVALLTVAIGSPCSCGTTYPGVVNITGVPTSTVNLSIMGTGSYQINAQPVDASSNVVSGATLTFCSNSSTVCSVDASGLITATSPGTAVITVCNGTVTKSINVNVTL